MTDSRKAFIAFVIAIVFAVISGVFAIIALTANDASGAQARTIVGTEHHDVIHTGNGGLTITWGLGGNDHLGGGRGTDIMHGGRGDDRIWTGSGGAKEAAFGGRGNDRLNDWRSGESPGYLNGGSGHDVCVGDKHDTFVRCERVVFKK